MKSITKWRIPGQGVAGRPCNVIIGKIGNADLSTWQYDHWHCHDRDCPVCEPYDRTRRVAKIATKVARVGNPRHFIFSPPQEKEYYDIKFAREQLYSAMGLLGILGAVVIFHPFRTERVGKDKYQHLNDLFFAPHFHVLCWGDYQFKSNEFEELTGWIYKNKGYRKSIRGTLYYLLGHCGIADKGHAVTYWGAARGYVQGRQKLDPGINEEMFTYRPYNAHGERQFSILLDVKSGLESTIHGNAVVWARVDQHPMWQQRVIYRPKRAS